jgi:hypothetical protein
VIGRLLLDADPPEKPAGGTTTTEPPKAPAEPAKEPAAKPSPPATKIEVDAAEYATLWSGLTTAKEQLAAFEAEKKAALEAAEQARLKAIGEKEGVEKALTERKTTYETKIAEATQRYANLETSLLGEAKSRVIAESTAGRPWASDHAAMQARSVLESRVDVSRDSTGKIVVRDKATGQFAGDSIPKLLDTDEFAHFFKPTSAGGSGATGGDLRKGGDPGAPSTDPQEIMLAKAKALASAPGGPAALSVGGYRNN